jgi:CRISPR-associated endonuclease/helicase Cas3
MLRLHADVLAGSSLAEVKAVLELDEPDQRAWLEQAAERASVIWMRLWLSGLAHARRPFAVHAGEQVWQVLRGPRLTPAERRLVRQSGQESWEDGVEITTDEEDSYHAGRPVSLPEHSGDVESFARRYARAAGLPDEIIRDVALAGYLHDIGKADPRFQLLLRGGDEVELAKRPEPWAKSGMPPEAKGAHRTAARRSGYPRGMRHEVMSVAMLASAREHVMKMAGDFELVQHLVGSHHGFCRPFAPAVEDQNPVGVALEHYCEDSEFSPIRFATISSANGLHRLDAPLAARFWGLVEQFGWWGLCWLETLLRLADHRASEKEQQP